MLKKSLIMKIFDAFFIQRWNDKIRPVELTEMDKTAHKMIIAYCLAKYEEDKGITYLYSGNFRGFVSNPLPSFWKEAISKSFK